MPLTGECTKVIEGEKSAHHFLNFVGERLFTLQKSK